MKHRQFNPRIQNPKNRRQTLTGLIISKRSGLNELSRNALRTS